MKKLIITLIALSFLVPASALALRTYGDQIQQVYSFFAVVRGENQDIEIFEVEHEKATCFVAIPTHSNGERDFALDCIPNNEESILR